MYRWLRFFLSSLALASLATQSRAVEVSLQLVGATYEDCSEDHANGLTCSPPVTATLLPAMPDGAGSVIDIDAAGVVIRAVLFLEEFSLEGVPVTPWTGTFEQPLTHVVTDPNHTRPFLLPGYDVGFWEFSLTRVTHQADFAGELTVWADQNAWDWRRWRFTFAFSALSTGVPPPCEGLRLDSDGDGEGNSRDALFWALDETFGSGVDENGLSVAEFCWVLGGDDARTCSPLDFRNDEPGRRKPRDCRLVRGPDRRCEAAEAFGPSTPVSPARACMRYAMIDDADGDGDGEPDTTDRCASTPSGSVIDGSGCSTQQFCSQQSVQLCRRADFGNDEPLAKKPSDCALTRSKPRSCAAATGN